MMMSVTKQVNHLPTRKAIFIVRDEGIELLVHRNLKYFNVQRIKFDTKLEIITKCIE